MSPQSEQYVCGASISSLLGKIFRKKIIMTTSRMLEDISNEKCRLEYVLTTGHGNRVLLSEDQ